MSARLKHIKLMNKADPHAVSILLRRIADTLDRADEGWDVPFAGGTMIDSGQDWLVAAWALVALLIGDLTDVDSSALYQLAATIDKGEQLELFAK